MVTCGQQLLLVTLTRNPEEVGMGFTNAAAVCLPVGTGMSPAFASSYRQSPMAMHP